MYKCLKQQTFVSGNYSLVPIRMDDRYDIMQWRNEQIYHLRQKEPLTEAQQDKYFEDVVSKLFDQEKPDQLLFSFLEGENLIGYGGLVHIDWENRNAEISFLVKTDLEKENFEFLWTKYLELVEELGYEELRLHKLFIYAFDLRPNLYKVLKKNKYFLDARLKKHVKHDDQFIDVVIYSKILTN